MNDALAWTLIGAVIIGYINTSVTTKIKNIGGPSQDREVDLSRWRHDGSQPVVWHSGNAASFVDETAQKMEMKLS